MKSLLYSHIVSKPSRHTGTMIVILDAKVERVALAFRSQRRTPDIQISWRRSKVSVKAIQFVGMMQSVVYMVIRPGVVLWEHAGWGPSLKQPDE